MPSVTALLFEMILDLEAVLCSAKTLDHRLIGIRTMTAADIDLGMRLKSQAGWNQVPADWHRMLAMQPEGCFVAELDGIAAGTAVACLLGKVAWIAMVLVDASVRGRGIGKALMQHAIAYAEAQGATCIRLDATPLGQPLYEKLGFMPQYALTRFAGLPAIARSDSAIELRLAHSADQKAIVTLDQGATGTDRSKFLLRLLQEQPECSHVALRDGHLAGFITMRPGSNAWHVGPCIADADAGEALLRQGSSQIGKEMIFVDIPEPNASAMQWATSAGLQRQRRLLRMCRGAAVTDDTTRLWASSGPELG